MTVYDQTPGMYDDGDDEPCDAHFTAFLAGLTPGKVLKDLHPVTKIERKRLRFMIERNKVRAAVALARETEFTPEQLAVAAAWAERVARVSG